MEFSLADPVCVEVSSADDGRDLVQALAARGLNADLDVTGTGCQVEVRSPLEGTEFLLADLLHCWRFGLSSAHVA